ncbi:hypothetical protein Q3G72_012965 [Acer saccharum]|nr:hypothetical protein Q3G72_012965 [Acer saccharum]
MLIHEEISAHFKSKHPRYRRMCNICNYGLSSRVVLSDLFDCAPMDIIDNKPSLETLEPPLLCNWRQDPHPTLSFLRGGPDLLASLHRDHDEPKEEQVCKEEEEEEKGLNRNSSPPMVTSSDNEDQEDIISVNHIVNKPPEKRQRAPSAYNRFIKEEIRRLKAENPNMAHKEAFSTAAKNRAHFPPIQYK